MRSDFEIRHRQREAEAKVKVEQSRCHQAAETEERRVRLLFLFFLALPLISPALFRLLLCSLLYLSNLIPHNLCSTSLPCQMFVYLSV